MAEFGKIKVLIADDHQIVLEGLRSLLEKEADIELGWGGPGRQGRPEDGAGCGPIIRLKRNCWIGSNINDKEKGRRD
jgi:hypothetical protein